jgi:class 3 adenylate cyclase/WD40 repeat protein
VICSPEDEVTEVTPTLLHGRYEVIAVVGRGGEGTLVRAVDRRHDRDVALKLRRVPTDPRDAERLLIEARTLLSLHPHPGLPLARDDFFEGDRHVLVMDWVDGVDLAAVLAEHGQPGLPPSTVLRWLAPVAEALTHLHTTDPPVVHGDVKPANVVLTPTGHVVLVDFGVSSTRGLRTRGGTPGYRAPEVAAGAVPTRAADVYGLAATAFALLAGQPPSGILPAWNDMDQQRAARLERALRRGLAINPAQRTATPGELVEELRAGWDSEPLPTGVVTFLATDVVASTRLWQELPDAAPGLLAEHLLVVDRAVERHGGRRIGDTVQGDATISAFHRAGDAVQAGIDLQRALAGGRVQVHCGVHSGEAVAADNSFAGATLSRVARVRALAEAGQVLLSATTARLATGDLSDVRLVDLGPHRLEGFDEPEILFAVDAPGLAVPPDPTQPPYRGLVPYDVDDDESYFGRDREIEVCLQRLAVSSHLAVVGPSGCGKSSLVRAGIASGLRRAGRSVAVFSPGSEPSAALRAALETAGPSTVLVIDQLEELFAPDIAPDVADRFLDDVVARLETAPVVVALRGDHVGSVGNHPNFARPFEAGLHLVSPMTDDELRDVMERPAHAAGLRLEPGLVERLLRDVGGEPGGLPLLSFALAQTWSKRDGRTLTVDGYLATGGLRQAIATAAEGLYEGLPPSERMLARALFLRLVSSAPDGEAVRQRIATASVVTDDDHRRVVDVFVRGRLVMAGDNSLEVAHEAVVREWPRLRTWLDEDVDGQRILRHLAVTAEAWDSMGRPDSELYRGLRLAQAVEWHRRATPDLTPVEQAFLDVSASRERAETHTKEEQLRRQARQNRRLRALLTAAAVLLVGVIFAGLLAVGQRNRADTAARDAQVQANRADTAARNAQAQANRADRQADETRARELAGLASLAVDEDPERAMLLGLAAAEYTDEPPAEALTALHRAAQSARLTSTIEGVMAASMDQSPDGSLLAVDRMDRTGYLLIDRATGKTVADVTTDHELGDQALAFDPTGSTLAVTYAPGADPPAPAVELFDAASRRPVGSLTGPDALYVGLDFDATGHWLGAISVGPGPGLTAVAWDVAAGGPPKSFGPAYDFELGGDGTSIVVGNGTHLTVFDIATGQRLREIETPPAVEYWDFELDPTGRLAVLVPLAGPHVDVVDTETGEVRTLDVRGPIIAQFGPDGRVLAVSGDDGLIRLYDTDDLVERQRLVGTSGAPDRIFFAPDGSHLLSARSGEIRTWDISPVGLPVLGNFQVMGSLLDRLVVAADESAAYATAYTASGNLSSVHRVDMRSGTDDEVLADVPWYFSTRPLVSPDLSVVATLDHDYTSELIQLPGGGSTRLERCESVRAFDEGGRVAALDAHLLCEERGQEPGVGSRIVDLETGDTLVDLGATVTIYAAALGPPGADGLPRSAVVEDRDSGEVTVYDLATGDAVGTYVSDTEWPQSLALSPDGARLALLMDSGRLVVLDVARLIEGPDPADATVFDVVAHTAGSKAVDFSKTGFIATGSSLDGVRVWSPDGQLLASVPTHQEDPPTFAFAPGTDTLYYEDGDGIVRRFAIDWADVTRLARSVLTRGFTPQECTRYFPDEPCPTF